MAQIEKALWTRVQASLTRQAMAILGGAILMAASLGMSWASTKADIADIRRNGSDPLALEVKSRLDQDVKAADAVAQMALRLERTVTLLEGMDRRIQRLEGQR